MRRQSLPYDILIVINPVYPFEIFQDVFPCRNVHNAPEIVFQNQNMIFGQVSLGDLPTHPNSKDWLSDCPSRRRRAVSISPFSIHQTEFFTVIRIAVNDDIVIAVLIRDISIYKRRYFTAAQHQSLHVVEVLYNAQPILAKINVLIYRRNNFGIVYVDCAWTWVR